MWNSFKHQKFNVYDITEILNTRLFAERVFKVSLHQIQYKILMYLSSFIAYTELN